MPISKARSASHPYHWVYRFGEGLPYTTNAAKAVDIIPGTECRNTGCCDADGTPIYEHDYVESWHSRRKHDMIRDVAEMIYVDGVLVKHIDGLADMPVAYQYRLDIYSPMRLDGTKVLGNSSNSGHMKTSRMTCMEYDRWLRRRTGGRK